MHALAALLEDEFGAGKLFRPYRDVRFSPDKSPYKLHAGMTFERGGYVQVSAEGLAAGAGVYVFDRDQLVRYRRAVDAPVSGAALEDALEAVADAGHGIEVSDALKTTPRGFDADHPRIELLRCKQLIANKSYGFESDAIDAGLVDRVRADWTALRPLVSWLGAVRVD